MLSAPRSSHVKKFIFILLYGLFLLALIEFISFLAYPTIRPVDDYSPELQVQGAFDPRIVFSLHPYYGFSKDPTKCHLPNTCNRFGFVGAELPSHKREDTVFIGIFGGSVAGKVCISGRERFLEKLQHYPYFKNKKIEFACVALGGFKQPQQLLALSYFLSLGLTFDIVINLDGFNEIALPLTENVPAHVEYSYPRMWNMYIQQGLNILALAQIRKIEKLRRAKKNLERAFSRGLLAHSYFLKLVLVVIDRLEYQKHLELYRNLLERSEREGLKKYQLYGPKEEYKDVAEITDKSVALWKTSSQQMAYLCKANNIRYFHFLQPNQYYSGMKRLSSRELETAYASDSPYVKAIGQGYPLVVREGKALEKEGVPFFDLTAVFINEPGDIYVDKCCHVNTRGNEILIDAIVDVIGSRPDPDGNTAPAPAREAP